MSSTFIITIKSEFKKNEKILINVFGNLLPILSGFFCLPLLKKEFNEAEFGAFILVWMLANVLSLLDCGLYRYTLNKIVRFREQSLESKISVGAELSGLLLLSCIIGGSAYVLKGVLFSGKELVLTTNEMDLAIGLTILSIPFLQFSFFCRTILEGFNFWGRVNSIRIPLNSFNYLTPLVLVLLGYRDFVLIMWVMLFGRMFFALYSFLILKQKVRELEFGFDSSGFRAKLGEIFSATSNAKWLGMVSMLIPFVSSLDRWFVNRFFGVSTLGYYGTPFEVVIRLAILPNAIINVLNVHFVSNAEDQNIDTCYSFLKKIVVCMLPVCGFFLFFSKEFLALWVDPDFSENSYKFLSIFSLGIFLNSVVAVPMNYVQFKYREKSLAKFYFIQILFYALMLIVAVKFSPQIVAFCWLLKTFSDFIFVRIETPKFLEKMGNSVFVYISSMILFLYISLEQDIYIRLFTYLAIVVFFAGKSIKEFRRLIGARQ